MGKIEDLQKLKELKDKGALNEQEFEILKEKVLDTEEIAQNSKINKNNRKKNIAIAVGIIIIGIIIAICISINLIDKILYKKVKITTDDGKTLQVNTTYLNNGIAEIKKKRNVSNNIGIVYKGNDISYYLIASSDTQKIGGDTHYKVSAIDNKNGSVVDCIEVDCYNGVFFYGKEYVVDRDNYINVLYMAEECFTNEDKILIASYESTGNIEILNDKTKTLKIMREKGINFFEDSYSYSEEVTKNEKYEPLEIIDKTGVNGRYTDKEYALANNGGYGSSCSSYHIQNGKIEYWDEYVVYQGTYVQDGNKLIVTYTKAYSEEQPVKLDIYSDELTIISENKLIKGTYHEFIKEK